MKVAEALDAVNRAYVPGVAKYYAGLDPDPWLVMHEELEEVMQKRDWRLTEAAADRFVARALELIDRFKREAKPGRGVSIADAVNMADDALVRQWQSRKSKTCLHCEATDKLTLLSAGPEGMDVVVICQACRAKRAG